MTLEWLIMIDEHYAIDQWLPNLRQACVRDKAIHRNSLFLLPS